MAVVDAMVARHFIDAEIWRTLESSALFGRRVESKGDRHARELYAKEITKATTTTPFAMVRGLRAGRPIRRPTISLLPIPSLRSSLRAHTCMSCRRKHGLPCLAATIRQYCFNAPTKSFK